MSTAKPMKKTATVKKSGKTKVVSNMDELDSMILELNNLRAQAKALGIDITKQQQEVLKEMGRLKIKSRQVKHKGKVLKAQVLQNSSLVYDETRLKKRLGSKLWDKVTTRVLDKKKLEAFVASGEVKASILAECSEDKQSAAFVKVT